MKRFLSLLVILPLLLWIACEDDSDENPLYGLWEVDQMGNYGTYGEYLGLVDVTQISSWFEITDDSYKQYDIGGTGDSLCYLASDPPVPAVITNLGDGLYQIDLPTLDFGIEIEIEGDRAFWNIDIDAYDEPTMGARKIDSYDFTPLCQ